MRRFLSVILALGMLAVAGCGGGSDSGSALDSALSVLPKDSSVRRRDRHEPRRRPVQGARQAAARSSRSAGRSRAACCSSSSSRAAACASRTTSSRCSATRSSSGATTANSSDVVAAMKAKDKGKLDDLVSKTKPQKTGEASGATLYKDGSTVFAVKDDLVVFANDEAQLKSALARADGGDHLDEKTFNDGLSGLPDSALARVYVDVEALLKRDPSTSDARMVKWIGALRQVGATVTAKDNAIDIDFRARTDGDLSDDDLPIASGDQSPPVIKRRGEVGLGIRDLAHIVHFAENAGPGDRPVRLRQLRAGQEDDRQAARGEPRRRPDRSAHRQRVGHGGARRRLRRARRAEGPEGVREDAGEGGRRAAELRGGRRLRHRSTLSKPKAGRKFYALVEDGRRRGDLRGRERRARGGERPEARGRGGRRPAGRRAGRERFGHAQRRRRAARDPDPAAVRARSSGSATWDRWASGCSRARSES